MRLPSWSKTLWHGRRSELRATWWWNEPGTPHHSRASTSAPLQHCCRPPTAGCRRCPWLHCGGWLGNPQRYRSLHDPPRSPGHTHTSGACSPTASCTLMPIIIIIIKIIIIIIIIIIMPYITVKNNNNNNNNMKQLYWQSTIVKQQTNEE